MISAGSSVEFAFRNLHQDSFLFVDYDNALKGLERTLRNIGLEDCSHTYFPLQKLLLNALLSKRIYLYSSIRKGDDPSAEISSLRAQPKVIFRETRLTNKLSGNKQEGVDVRLAVEAITCAHKNLMRHCVIFSDDGDFLPLVNALVNEGVHTTVVSYGNPDASEVASRLRDACDVYIQLGYSILWNTYQSTFATNGGSILITQLSEKKVEKLEILGKEIMVEKQSDGSVKFYEYEEGSTLHWKEFRSMQEGKFHVIFTGSVRGNVADRMPIKPPTR